MSRFEVDSFIPPPDPEFLCSICRNVLDQPKETPCHHVFCEVCITKALQAKRKCPVCRSRCRTAQLKAVIPLVQNLLNKLTMKCVNFRDGQEHISCNEVIKMEYYLEHLDKCEYAYIECPFVGCKLQILKKVWTHHKDACDYRLVVCSQGCDLKFVWAHRQSHSCAQELKQLNKDLKEENMQLKRELQRMRKTGIEKDLSLHVESDGGEPDPLDTAAAYNDSVESRVTSSSGGVLGDADAAGDASNVLEWEREGEAQAESDSDGDYNPGDIYEDYEYDEYNESFDESDNYDDYYYGDDFDDGGDDDSDEEEDDGGDDEALDYEQEEFDSGEGNAHDRDTPRPANENFIQSFNQGWSDVSTQASSSEIDQHRTKRGIEQTMLVVFAPSKRPRLDLASPEGSQNINDNSSGNDVARRSARLQGLEAGPSLISNVEIPPSASELLDLHGNDDEDSEDDPSFSPTYYS